MRPYKCGKIRVSCEAFLKFDQEITRQLETFLWDYSFREQMRKEQEQKEKEKQKA